MKLIDALPVSTDNSHSSIIYIRVHLLNMPLGSELKITVSLELLYLTVFYTWYNIYVKLFFGEIMCVSKNLTNISPQLSWEGFVRNLQRGRTPARTGIPVRKWNSGESSGTTCSQVRALGWYRRFRSFRAVHKTCGGVTSHFK